MGPSKKIATITEEFLNNLTIDKKLLVLYGFSFLLPMFIIVTMLTLFLYNNFLEKDLQQAEGNVLRLEKSLSMALEKIVDLSDRFYANDRIHQAVLREYHSVVEVFEEYTQLSFLDDFLRLHPEVACIRLFVENQALLNNSYFIQTTDSIRNREWYRRATLLNGRIMWGWEEDVISRNRYIFLFRLIRKPLTGQCIGVLSIGVSPDYLYRLFEADFFSLYLAMDNRIVWNKDSALYGKTPEWLSKDFFRKDEIVRKLKVEIGKTKYAVITKTFSPKRGAVNDFQLIYTIPMQDILRPTVTMILFSLLILSAGLVFSISFIVLFSKYFWHRITLIREELNRVVQKDFAILPSIGGKDELAEIHNDIFLTIQNIKELIQEVYVRKIEQGQLLSQQREIQFKMLVNQINPHFLYNTLETIRMKALANQDREVAYTVKLLGKILRRSLDFSEKPVTLLSELELVSSYLEIQRIRFGNRVHYDIVTLCDAQHILILPFLLQPIVENAFTHGLESKIEGGFIYITTSCEKGLLTIQVKDNGKGMSKERLWEIREQLQKPKEGRCTSIGLLNVQQRIHLYYGDAYGITIDSTEEEGTTVTIVLPLPTKEP
ncbi:sensor histidine kinase [Treponema sp. J25]|uniref:cache domain-containing sensor histidine kinase n=1 Tax=Treponema sp. J25 TaxID=2094121 RepID=UPI001049D812|nr:sensor histidine kinase [Treponema sp. J25]TCW62045.1 hypothetical protein C5O22_03140 [Treponema sp. J25]